MTAWDDYRVAVAEASKGPGRRMVRIFCPHCRHHQPKCDVVDTAHGPLFRSWVNPRGVPRKNNYEHMSGQLLDMCSDTEPLIAYCADHGPLVVSNDEVASAVAKYRQTGREQKVRAEPIEIVDPAGSA